MTKSVGRRAHYLSTCWAIRHSIQFTKSRPISELNTEQWLIFCIASRLFNIGSQPIIGFDRGAHTNGERVVGNLKCSGICDTVSIVAGAN